VAPQTGARFSKPSVLMGVFPRRNLSLVPLPVAPQLYVPQNAVSVRPMQAYCRPRDCAVRRCRSTRVPWATDALREYPCRLFWPS
jgi:hypothetical protein